MVMVIMVHGVAELVVYGGRYVYGLCEYHTHTHTPNVRYTSTLSD